MQTFATLMFTKISICFLLLRFTVHKAFIRPIQALIASLIVSNIILTVLYIVQCRPLARAWNKTIEGTCFSDGQLQRIIIAQASRLFQITFQIILEPFKTDHSFRSNINHIRLHSRRLSHSHPSTGPDKFPNQSRPMQSNGSWCLVSI